MADVHEKRSSIERLLGDGYVMIHVVTTHPGVVIPDYLRANPTVTLKLSKQFLGSMELLEDKIEVSLRFSGVYSECAVPYAAVWGCTTEKGKSIVWPDGAPADILQLITKESSAPSQAQAAGEDASTAKQKVGHLRRVK